MTLSPLVAIDLAILLPDRVAASARAINAALTTEAKDDLRLDGTHLPHLTLAQQFVERLRLEDLYVELDRLLRHEPPLPLRISGTSVEHGTAWFLFEAAPDLQRLHEMVMDALEPFESPDATAAAFQSDGETIRPRDVEWVANYREQAAYAHFRPHVTLGHGVVPALPDRIDFRVDHVALCHLGRFCTCRALLREWWLGKD